MATLEALGEEHQVLSKYKHRHRPVRGTGREMWFFREAADWLVNQFGAMEPFYEGSLSTRKQAAILLKNFVTGEPFEHRINFWHMRPYRDDIFELKTADLRLFGWFYRPKIFIVGRATTFAVTHASPGMHDGFRDEVIRMRDELDLDEPKWVVGATAEDVF